MTNKLKLDWSLARTMKLSYLMLGHLNITSYFFCCGTLLGILRHGDLIPHDHDVDIMTNDISGFRKIKQNEALFPKDIRVKVSCDADCPKPILKILDMNICQ